MFSMRFQVLEAWIGCLIKQLKLTIVMHMAYVIDGNKTATVCLVLKTTRMDATEDKIMEDVERREKRRKHHSEEMFHWNCMELQILLYLLTFSAYLRAQYTGELYDECRQIIESKS